MLPLVVLRVVLWLKLGDLPNRSPRDKNDLSKLTPVFDLDLGLINSEPSLRLPIRTNLAHEKPMLKNSLLFF